ncbi:MAG: response regulator transcription factor [Flavobacteriia bacterium]|nr:response regulator transcription factor [Flavobacteriia bacterium]
MDKVKIIVYDPDFLISSQIDEMELNLFDFFVVNSKLSGQELINLIDIKEISIFVSNIDYSISESIQLIKFIKESIPGFSIILVTSHTCIKICNFLKDSKVEAILKSPLIKLDFNYAIHSILKGKKYFFFDNFDKTQNSKKNLNLISELTKREIEVLRLIALGNTNTDVAKILFISHRTVDTHRTNIMRKIKTKNVVELIHFALINKIIH